jgi:hypothetical protein
MRRPLASAAGRTRRRIAGSRTLLLAGRLAIALAVAGCAGEAATASPEPAGERPASPAIVGIVAPEAGEKVAGPTIRVIISLAGAEIVPETTTDLRPDTGHVHLYIDNGLVSMNYGLEQDVEIASGTHAVKAEFVAADHAPFNPRVWSDDVIFSVE